MSKTLKSITYNDDGSMDLTDSDGVVYKNCWIESYSTSGNDSTIIKETAIAIEYKGEIK